MEELRAQNEKLVLEVQAGRRLAYDNAQLLETAAARIVQLEAQVADLVRQNTEAAFTNAKRLGTNSPGGVSSQDDIDRRVAAAVANVENGHKQTIVRLQGEMVEERRKAQADKDGLMRELEEKKASFAAEKSRLVALMEKQLKELTNKVAVDLVAANKKYEAVEAMRKRLELDFGTHKREAISRIATLESQLNQAQISLENAQSLAGLTKDAANQAALAQMRVTDIAAERDALARELAALRSEQHRLGPSHEALEQLRQEKEQLKEVLLVSEGTLLRERENVRTLQAVVEEQAEALRRLGAKPVTAVSRPASPALASDAGAAGATALRPPRSPVPPQSPAQKTAVAAPAVKEGEKLARPQSPAEAAAAAAAAPAARAGPVPMSPVAPPPPPPPVVARSPEPVYRPDVPSAAFTDRTQPPAQVLPRDAVAATGPTIQEEEILRRAAEAARSSSAPAGLLAMEAIRRAAERIAFQVEDDDEYDDEEDEEEEQGAAAGAAVAATPQQERGRPAAPSPSPSPSAADPSDEGFTRQRLAGGRECFPGVLPGPTEAFEAAMNAAKRVANIEGELPMSPAARQRSPVVAASPAAGGGGWATGPAPGGSAAAASGGGGGLAAALERAAAAAAAAAHGDVGDSVEQAAAAPPAVAAAESASQQGLREPEPARPQTPKEAAAAPEPAAPPPPAAAAPAEDARPAGEAAEAGASSAPAAADGAVVPPTAAAAEASTAAPPEAAAEVAIAAATDSAAAAAAPPPAIGADASSSADPAPPSPQSPQPPPPQLPTLEPRKAVEPLGVVLKPGKQKSLAKPTQQQVS